MYNYDYLRIARESKGYSTYKAAELMHMDQANYWKMETGHYQNIPLKKLKLLHEVLGVDLYHLLNIQ